jgi:hypothetical protein
MATSDDVRVTTELLWQTTVFFSVVAVALLLLLGRLVPRQRFATLKLRVVGASFFAWLIIWSAVVLVYWQSVYSFFFPAWLRWLLPLLMATGFATVSFFLWHLANRARRWPVVVFVLLGAALGPLTHVWAVVRGIVSKPPLLQGASPAAAIAVSAPEFALYYSAIVGLAVLSARVAEGRRRKSTAGVSGTA